MMKLLYGMYPIDEGEIIVETDTGLSIDRKVRIGKAPYKSVKRDGLEVGSPEAFLKELFTPLQLNPIEFMNMDKKQQNAIILDMIEYPWDMNKIKEWFGEIPAWVSYDQNILSVLNDIQAENGDYYQNRRNIDRDIRNKKAFVEEIANGIPVGYDVEKWEQAKAVADQAERDYLDAQAGILAENLTEGMPCPVCGSVHHPAKAVRPAQAPTQAEWNRLREAEKTEREKTEILSRKSGELKISLEHFRDNVRNGLKKLGLEKSAQMQELAVSLQTEESKLNADLKETKKQEKDLLDIPDELEKAKAEQQSLQKSLDTTDTILRQQESALGQKQGEYSQLKQRIGDGTLAEAQAEWKKLCDAIREKEEALQDAANKKQQAETALARTQALLKQTEQNHQEGCEAKEQAKDAFLKTLEEQHFKDKADFASALVSREILEQAEEKNRAYFADLQTSQQQLVSREKEAAGKTYQDLTELEERMERLRVEKGALQEKVQEQKALWQTRKKAAESAWKELQAWKKAEKAYLPIVELSKTANGELAQKDKIAFEQFVQGFYFDRILAAANLRFAEMTNGRYHLRRSEVAANKRSQSGLELEVMDYFTGKARGVKSLSGGEAFKASLSLALGLSDLIQQTAGGVEIKAMFIDEGFGALDEESREQAVRILQQLSYGDRMVGIISHVTELKESIEKKLIVKKSSTGSTVFLEV